jgi:NADPH:quinone reductase
MSKEEMRMQAVVLRKFGDPEVLRYEEVPTPIPGPGEVLVRVHAVSVNRTLDLKVRQDGGGYGVGLPLVLGVDPSGVVVAGGEGVTQPQRGARVAIIPMVGCGTCPSCQAGNETACRQLRIIGLHRWGGYAEYIVVPARNTFAIPDGLSFADATIITRHFPMAFGEARKAHLQAGEWVLVMGAAGALGSCLVQVAKMTGARVIAGAGSDERVAVARSFGADCGVNYRQEDLAKAVMQTTEGQGVDVVFENIGDATLWPGAFNSLAAGGRLVTVGAHGGGMVTLDVKRLYSRRLQIMSGIGAERREDVERSLQLAAAGQIRLLIDRAMPLRETAAAHRLMEQDNPCGKIILDPTLG